MAAAEPYPYRHRIGVDIISSRFRSAIFRPRQGVAVGGHSFSLPPSSAGKVERRGAGGSDVASCFAYDRIRAVLIIKTLISIVFVVSVSIIAGAYQPSPHHPNLHQFFQRKRFFSKNKFTPTLLNLFIYCWGLRYHPTGASALPPFLRAAVKVVVIIVIKILSRQVSE